MSLVIKHLESRMANLLKYKQSNLDDYNEYMQRAEEVLSEAQGYETEIQEIEATLIKLKEIK